MQPVTYEAVASASLTLGTSLADVTGTSIALTTLTDGALYIAEASFDMNIATAAAGQLAEGHLDVNGADQTARALKLMTAVDRATVSQRWRGTLTTAGSHTLKLRGIKSGASGVASIVLTHTKLQVTIYEVV
ncbi:hypothetical protein ACN26Y_29835 [Micromonospora sp. WMMD558]|uniref:hypothetical protein n=1 Tax=Micromonospora sp. WMMD558 TaxID=3403462 RepID=UPI003BF55050